MAEERNGAVDVVEAEPEVYDSAQAAEDAHEAAEVQSEMDRLIRERDELNDRYLRAVAEFDNARKRLRAEQSQVLQYANERLIRELLPVLDNLERALESETDGDSDSLRSGVQLTARMFADILGKFSVTPIPALGESFDPNKHEAIGQIESDEHQEGTIIEEVQRGYAMRDRVIRPSLVRVAQRTTGN